MTTATRRVRIRIVRWDPAFLGYYLGYSAASKADFEWALAIVKQLSPGQRRWLPKHNCCWVSDGAVMELVRTFSPLRHYLADQANSSDDQRRQRQDDQQEQRQQYAGQAHAWDNRFPSMPKDVLAAFTSLHLTRSAPPVLVVASRRVLARRYHPDAGGAHLLMVKINRAADVAEAGLAEHAST